MRHTEVVFGRFSVGVRRGVDKKNCPACAVPGLIPFPKFRVDDRADPGFDFQ